MDNEDLSPREEKFYAKESKKKAKTLKPETPHDKELLEIWKGNSHETEESEETRLKVRDQILERQHKLLLQYEILCQQQDELNNQMNKISSTLRGLQDEFTKHRKFTNQSLNSLENLLGLKVTND